MARTIVRGYSFRPDPEESLTKELTTEADTLDQVVSDLHQEGFEHVSIVEPFAIDDRPACVVCEG